MKIQNTFLIIILGCTFLTSQTPQFKLGLWEHKALSGSLSLEGLYRAQETIYANGNSEKPQTTLFNGSLQLHSKSIFWHPNFMELDIDLDYSPASRFDQFLVIPNRSETRTTEQLRINSTFFKQKPLSLSFFTNWNHSFINREFTSNIESYNRDFGGGLSFKNPIVPFTLNYLNASWEQQEKQSGRNYTNDIQTVRSSLNKSFSEFDDNRFDYAYSDYKRDYSNAFSVNNISSDYRLQNMFYFDKSRRSSLNSLAWYYEQKGAEKFTRLQLNERIAVQLPYNFKASTKYNYSNYDQGNLQSDQQIVNFRLDHKLYQSLNSFAHYEYNDFAQTTFDEFINRYGFGFKYNKRLAASGRLTLSYEYTDRSERFKSNPLELIIVNEEHELDDNMPLFLNNPFVDLASIIITNEEGTIIYQENFDYIVVERGEFTEIQRLPGGQIANGQQIYIDYNVLQPRSYTFDAVTNNIYSSLSFFEQFVEIYFRYYEQDNTNISSAQNLVLKNIVQRTSGIRLTKNFISAGYEHDNFRSNIIPYQSNRYFLSLNHSFSQKISGQLNGNLRDYKLTNENESQQFSDISARVTWFITRISNLKFEGGYRVQKGRGLDLNLANWKTEFATRYRSIILKAGIENYYRDFINEQLSYFGGFLKLERQF